MTSAEIGIFGGSGVYSLLENARDVEIDTPYGKPSAPISVGEFAGRSVAFLPRHGRKHEFPPHAINYRANVWALHELGVSRILAPIAAGSLQPHVRRGDFVVCDQLVDRTSGRTSTFYDGPSTTHISFADPFCSELRGVAIKAARDSGLTTHESGTVVVIQGPRFSTRAESKWFSDAGWEVVNMTQYPESVLAREQQMCYVSISLITDYDAGVEGVPAVTVGEVIKVFEHNIPRLRALMLDIVPRIPSERHCSCATALEGATIGHSG
ncbi:MAG: S-methyl-5'-thioadenosine phosphorylase [Actinomycetota bacterium]